MGALGIITSSNKVYVVSLIKALRLPPVSSTDGAKDKTSLPFINSNLFTSRLSLTYKSSTFVNPSILTLKLVSFKSLISCIISKLVWYILPIPSIRYCKSL